MVVLSSKRKRGRLSVLRRVLVNAQAENMKAHRDSFNKFYEQYGQLGSWVEKYPTYMRLYAECRYERRNTEILRRVGNPQGYVLDLGCGVGDIVGSLADDSKRVVGLEMSEVNMASCRQNVKGVPLFLGAGEHLPFQNASFDVVILADVIEHVVDAKSVVLEISRVLVPSGTLILTTPHKRVTEFWALCDQPWTWIRGGSKQQVTIKDELLSTEEIETLLIGGGFSIVEHRMIEFYPNTGWFGAIMWVIGDTLRTRLVEPLCRTLFKHLERLQFLNSRQLVVARKP